MVPNVPWHRAPHRKGAPRATKKKILGYLIFIYIGNQITDIRNTLRYVHDLMGIYYTRFVFSN